MIIIENLKINGQIVDKDILDYNVPTQQYPYWIFYTTEGNIYATGNVAFLVKEDKK